PRRSSISYAQGVYSRGSERFQQLFGTGRPTLDELVLSFVTLALRASPEPSSERDAAFRQLTAMAINHLPFRLDQMVRMIQQDTDKRIVQLRSFSAISGVLAVLLLIIQLSYIFFLITKQRKLLISEENAKAANLAKTKFLESISHELRTPLNSIIGFSDLLLPRYRGRFGQAEIDDYSLEINRSGKDMLFLVNQIIQLSEITSETPEPKNAPVELRGELEALFERLRQRASSKHIKLVMCDDFPDIIVNADERMLRQKFTILLSNSIELGLFASTVLVSVEEGSAGGFDFTIHADGAHISEENLVALFEPYHHSSQEDLKIGLRLGLPIARRLAEANGIELTICTADDGGAQFCLFFPANRIDSVHRASASSDQRSTG
ncbi:MAG: HAMP domain-containing sensor histidine kinase, partial [Pseudomonadota bacterium]